MIPTKDLYKACKTSKNQQITFEECHDLCQKHFAGKQLDGLTLDEFIQVFI